MTAPWFPLALALHATGVALALVLRRHPAACRWAAFLASTGGSVATIVLGASVLATGGVVRGALFANAAVGVTVGYAVDPLSAWFLLTFAVLAAPVAVYGVGYLAHAIGAPFERHVYRPATRAVLAAAGRLRVIQAGSLHAYLAYVLVLGVILLWWLGGLP